jgi:hypothetical protein
MAKKKAEQNGILEIPVNFGGFSNGDRTCRIGIEFDRSALSLSKCDQHLCDKRITGTLYALAKGDAPGQATMPGTEGTISVDGVFDVKGFKVSTEHISAGLTFSNKDRNLRDCLCDMAKRSGRLVIESVAAIEGDGDGEDEEED